MMMREEGSIVAGTVEGPEGAADTQDTQPIQPGQLLPPNGVGSDVTGPIGSVTQATTKLADAQAKDLLSACGYYDKDLSTFKKLFRKHADLETRDLTDAKRLSFTSFLALFRDLGMSVPSVVYAQQYYRAWDLDGNGSIDFREFCLGLLVMDPDIPRNPGKQWLRCRLEMIFRFYDLDNDGILNMSNFIHLVRHMLRMARRPHDLDSSARVARALAKQLPVQECAGLTAEQFIDLVTGGAFRQHGLHTSELFRLPRFRQQVKAHTEMAAPPATGILKRKDEVSTRIEEKAPKAKKQVRVADGHNEIPITAEGKGRKPTSVAAHPHLKNKRRKVVDVEMTPEELQKLRDMTPEDVEKFLL
eukprot:g8666.t1